MNSRAVFLLMSAVASAFGSSEADGQQTIAPDLSALAGAQGLQVYNRTLTAFTDGVMKGVRFDAKPGDGIAYLKGIEFANGTIELDIRGKDVQGQSFVGVAFHGVDSTIYDAIYFRPFNFLATDSARLAHAVQYISHPMHTWDRLRNEHPGAYEKPVSPPPDPNGWVHARIVIAGPTVSVFVGEAREPSLVVKRLSERPKGLAGVWVGNGSAGDFANLRIRPGG